MCGVAGIFAYHYAATPVDRDELRAIRDHMAARGPDGKGEWFADNHRVALGHRRLAIIDLSNRAAQPMASADGQLVISFNGEIYNYRQLKKDLEARGCIFRTESDTEVLLHLYAEKGEAMLGELRGMFAFALWDARKQAMLLARDPFGIKPLYYADDGWTCRFASQVKALLVSDKVSRLPEPAGLAGFYLFGSVPEPYTLYQEIRSVPAGSYLWVDATGPSHPVQYFSIAQAWAEGEQTRPLDPAELQQRVREAVLDSVRHHMVADVPVGAFLSAGIDSGALVGLMAEASCRRPAPGPKVLIATGSPRSGSADAIQSITLAFAEFRNTHADEAPLAEMVARHYGVDHTTRIVGEQEFRDDLPNILAAMDQPSIDGINTWFVSKAASEAGLKVAVSGLGGDELFGGYPSFRDIPRWVRLLWLPSHLPGLGALAEQVQAAFVPLFPRINPKAAGMLRYGGTYPGAWLLRRGLFLPRELPALIGKDMAQEGLRRLQPLQHIQRQLAFGPGAGLQHSSVGAAPLCPSGCSPRTTAMHTAYAKVATLESALYMRNQLLRDTDWASMAHSLEIRTPLVDATLLRQLAGPLATATPSNHKHLLANSPARPLPDEIANRAKSGFTTPISDWQQRGDSIPAWRKVPTLVRKNCPWARRWCFAVKNNLSEC
jgi:asparagine synthase (glutamine-hydrolysing)